MAVFPELFLLGHNSGRVADLAEPAGGGWSAHLSSQATGFRALK